MSYGQRSMKGIAKRVRRAGEGDDVILAHIHPIEARELEQKYGKTMNPVTGLPQYGKLFKKLMKPFKFVEKEIQRPMLQTIRPQSKNEYYQKKMEQRIKNAVGPNGLDPKKLAEAQQVVATHNYGRGPALMPFALGAKKLMPYAGALMGSILGGPVGATIGGTLGGATQSKRNMGKRALQGAGIGLTIGMLAPELHGAFQRGIPQWMGGNGLTPGKERITSGIKGMFSGNGGGEESKSVPDAVVPRTSGGDGLLGGMSGLDAGLLATMIGGTLADSFGGKRRGRHDESDDDEQLRRQMMMNTGAPARTPRPANLTRRRRNTEEVGPDEDYYVQPYFEETNPQIGYQ